jgi:hypothetical protein
MRRLCHDRRQSCPRFAGLAQARQHASSSRKAAGRAARRTRALLWAAVFPAGAPDHIRTRSAGPSPQSERELRLHAGDAGFGRWRLELSDARSRHSPATALPHGHLSSASLGPSQHGRQAKLDDVMSKRRAARRSPGISFKEDSNRAILGKVTPASDWTPGKGEIRSLVNPPEGLQPRSLPVQIISSRAQECLVFMILS